jgi:hypothetical protein
MKIRRAALIVVAGIITASCSEKSVPGREKLSEAKREPDSVIAKSEDELQPREDEIGEDAWLSFAPRKLFLRRHRLPIAPDVLPPARRC